MVPEQRTTSTASLKIARIGVEIFWYLGWLALVMSIGLTILTFSTGYCVKYIHPPLQIDLQQIDESELPHLSARGSLPIIGFGPIMIEASADDPLQPFLLMMPVSLLLCYLYVFLNLRRFLRSIVTVGFFASGNVGCLRRIAWTVLVVGPLWGVLDIIYAKLYESQVSIGVGEFEPIVDMHPDFMIAGVILLVITQAFEYGHRLQREQDLTV